MLIPLPFPLPEERKAFAKCVDVAADFTKKVLGPAAEQVGFLLGDSVALWVLRNRIRVILKGQALLQRHGIKTNPTMPAIFVPLIQDAGNVDDEMLSDMFANLLAGNLDPAYQDKVHPSYAKILAQMSPLDAQLLVAFGPRWKEHPRLLEDNQPPGPGRNEMRTETTEWLAKQIGVSPVAAYMSFRNLERLGLMGGSMAWNMHEPVSEQGNPYIEAHLTSFGEHFREACSRYEDNTDGNGTA